MDVAIEKAAWQGKINTAPRCRKGRARLVRRSRTSGNWRPVLWLRYRPNGLACMNSCSYQDEPAINFLTPPYFSLPPRYIRLC
jgi:hypothetical protein